MAISSSTTGLRPGVCTSSTRPTSPYTGQIIYETDTGYLRTWDGAAWDYLSKSQNDTIGLGAVGWVYITSVDLGGNTAVNLDNCFTSSFDVYQVIVTNFRGDSAGYLFIQTRSGSPVSTDTGANYVYAENLGAQAKDEVIWRWVYSYNTTDRGNVIATIFEPTNSATGTSYNAVGQTRNSTTGFLSMLSMGQKETQSADTGLRFTHSGGAVAMNGLVTVLGLRKA